MRIQIVDGFFDVFRKTLFEAIKMFLKFYLENWCIKLSTRKLVVQW